MVYVTCPPKGSPRKLAMEFARFLGLPLRTRANVTDIADAVCQVLIDALEHRLPGLRPRYRRIRRRNAEDDDGQHDTGDDEHGQNARAHA